MKRLTGHLTMLAWLTLVWVLLWGTLTAANVLGGLALGIALLVLLPVDEVPRHGRLRPVALVRFLAVFLWELVKASVVVVLQVLRPRAQLRQAVIAVPVIATTDRLLTLVANAVSLTPGTLTLEVDRDTRTMYVHVLNVAGESEGVEDERRAIVRLERLAILAIGSAESRAALAASTRHAEVGP